MDSAKQIVYRLLKDGYITLEEAATLLGQGNTVQYDYQLGNVIDTGATPYVFTTTSTNNDIEHYIYTMSSSGDKLE